MQMRSTRVLAPVLGVLAFVLAAAPAAAADQTVFRCESKEGRVTYSDEPCPSGSRAARKLDESPPVVIPAGKDTPRSARDVGQIVQSRTVSNSRRSDPYQENRVLDEQIAGQRRECAELARRVQYARQDVDAAVTGNRSSAELALRRAQDQFQLFCPRR